jgi:hypothetical protein
VEAVRFNIHVLSGTRIEAPLACGCHCASLVPLQEGGSRIAYCGLKTLGYTRCTGCLRHSQVVDTLLPQLSSSVEIVAVGADIVN